jgi:hypothetical protein
MKNQENYPGTVFNPVEVREKMNLQAKKAYLLCCEGSGKGLKFHKKSQKKERMLRMHNRLVELMENEQDLGLRIRYFARNLKIVRIKELPYIIKNLNRYF